MTLAGQMIKGWIIAGTLRARSSLYMIFIQRESQGSLRLWLVAGIYKVVSENVSNKSAITNCLQIYYISTYVQILYIFYLLLFTYVVLDTFRPLSRFVDNSTTFDVKKKYFPELLLWFWQLNFIAELIRKV
jgi:hypothetical protein